MREIKFRVFKNGKMYYPVHKSNAKNDDLLEVYFDSEPWNIKTSGFLMQYTGLKDKNGVEIYEGDIVSSKEHGIDKAEVNYFVGCPNIEGFGIFINFVTNYFSNVLTEFEIVGNIYETPELLK